MSFVFKLVRRIYARLPDKTIAAVGVFTNGKIMDVFHL